MEERSGPNKVDFQGAWEANCTWTWCLCPILRKYQCVRQHKRSKSLEVFPNPDLKLSTTESEKLLRCRCRILSCRLQGETHLHPSHLLRAFASSSLTAVTNAKAGSCPSSSLPTSRLFSRLQRNTQRGSTHVDTGEPQFARCKIEMGPPRGLHC